ncbi:MAG: helix-turn-helix transcriptional regulator, partial [Panacagrimonas sp.]
CSPRTLMRRLKALNTSYHEVVDKVKKHRACELLANEQLRIRDIADVLGYGDAGGFVRSFKRCLGVTPGQYRHQMLRPRDSLQLR